MGLLYYGTLLALFITASALFGVGYKQNKVSLGVFASLCVFLYVWCALLSYDRSTNEFGSFGMGALQLLTVIFGAVIAKVGVNRQTLSAIYFSYLVFGIVLYVGYQMGVPAR